jgi:pantoate--beta-alanine ligase
LAEGTEKIRSAGFEKVDYFELRDAENLQPLDRLQPNARLFAAAWLGPVRLIDNIAVTAS